MAMARVYFRNEDNADIYLSVYDEYAKKSVFDEEFLADGDTKHEDFELSDGTALISWECYRRDNNDKVGSDDDVEVSAGQTVEVSTD
jgi:hypothetical protein